MNKNDLKEAIKLFEDDLESENYKHIVESSKEFHLVATLFQALQQADVYPFNQLPSDFPWRTLLVDLFDIRNSRTERTEWISNYFLGFDYTDVNLNHLINVLFALGVPYVYEVDESVTGLKDYVYSYCDVDDFIRDDAWASSRYKKDMFTRLLDEVA